MFSDRIDAGDQLAERLSYLRDRHPVVIGLPRGGVPVACRVARALDAPLDLVLVRKLGVPFQPELAMGAIADGGVRVINEEVVRMAGITPRELDEVTRHETVELDRRAARYRHGRPPVPLTDRLVIVVDDGVATGSTARAACQVVRARGAERVILAVPVAPPSWTERLAGAADELVALETPPRFRGVGQFYRDFGATADEEVIRCLDVAAERAAEHTAEHEAERAAAAAIGDPAATARPGDPDVEIDVGDAVLHGHLSVPDGAVGLVIFAHGAGSSRHSPRNRFVATVLNAAGLATLLFDLLTEDEEPDRAFVFDISLLGRRLLEVTRWAVRWPGLEHLPVGYFGASTGAAAALWAAADPGVGGEVKAVVSRGGRPDLATDRLPSVHVPTLLLVGSLDREVLRLNRQAATQLGGEVRVEVVPGASHLFQEPGTLPEASVKARDWFLHHLAGRDLGL